MKGSIQRRVSVAINWSAARIASLDTRERYEDSYALTEEFREWILCADEHPELLAEQVLMVPNFKTSPRGGQDNESEGLNDGILEI
ncbi:MAG: hypothetical protein EBX49_00770 [Synechococcaceae bacterium WB8_1B_136]|nr:hypothetical protein [Synechococcaceae bacterium WB8_1B_136]